MLYNKKVILKNNSVCIIENASENNACEILDLLKRTCVQSDFLLSYPEEIIFTVEQERDFLESKKVSNDEVLLCAKIDGKIIGTASINKIGNNYKVKHRAEFAVAIEKDFWNIGVGNKLSLACIESAKMSGYKQLELTVVSTNFSAISLYKKIGFVEYGRNPKGFLLKNGEWRELIQMRLELD